MRGILFLKKFLEIKRKGELFSRPVMRQLLIPLAFMLLCLFFLFLFLLWKQHNEHVDCKLSYQQSSLIKEFHVDLKNQAFGLNAALLVLGEDSRLSGAFQRPSRELFTEWESLFEVLRRNFRIREFLFLNHRGVTLFRAHNPGRQGDRVDHAVLFEAERTRKAAWGLELDSGGILSLRVVQPIFSEDLLVGYVEIAKGIDDILEERQGQQEAVLAVAIEKNRILRSLWESRMRSLGREARWDRISHRVLAYISRGDLPEAFYAMLNATFSPLRSTEKKTLSFEGKTWILMASPLSDAWGEEVGSVIVLWDISPERMAFFKSLFFAGGAAGAFLLVILGCMIVFLGRADAKVLHQQRALEESRERFRLLADDLPALLCEFAHDGRLLFVNKAYCTCFDMTPEELRERYFLDFVHPEERKALERAYRSFTRVEPLVINVHRVMSKGGIRWQEWRDRPLFNEHGRLVGYRAIGVDITERKEMQEQLQRTNRSLQEAILQTEKASMAKSEFLANMSHEIRTPLHAVLGMGELLAETDLQEEQRQFLNVLISSGEALLALIEEILDFSRIEAGKVELKMQDFHLPRLLESLVAPLAVQAREKDVVLEYSIQEAVAEFFRGDPVRLRQILTNLLGNAIKFTSRGEVRLSVSLEPGDLAGASPRVIRFSVRDTGIGIPQEKIPLLFKRFSQVDSSPTRQYRGTGLGLAISKHLVELMGGTLQVQSEEGYGSEFWFVLPLEKALVNSSGSEE